MEKRLNVPIKDENLDEIKAKYFNCKRSGTQTSY